MKRNTLIAGIVTAIIVLLGVLVGMTANAQVYKDACPLGQYPIDDGICRLEPTGCPDGDSIPLEKCPYQTTNPYRDSYDQYGNRYNYKGELIQTAPGGPTSAQEPVATDSSPSWGK